MQFDSLLQHDVPELLQAGQCDALAAALAPLVCALRNGDLDEEEVGRVFNNCLYPYAAILQDLPFRNGLLCLHAFRPLWQQVGTKALQGLGVENPWVVYVNHENDLYHDMTAEALYALLNAC